MVRSALAGTRIRERRSLRGLRQADLARAVGISPAYLNLIEHNRRRPGPELLAALAAELGVEPIALSEGSEGALYEALREAAAAAAEAGPGQGADTPPELDRIEVFVGRFPGWAALLAAQRARVGALERVVEGYAERMAQDPFLGASLHEVLSAVASLRSTAAILAESEDIEPEWRARFHRTIHEESLRLSATAEGLVAYLDTLEEAETGLSSPLEELEAWLAGRGWHVPETETGATAGIRAAIAGAGVAELASRAARALALAHLDRAEAEARALPAPALAEALARLGPAPDRIAADLGVPLLTVLRRLALGPATGAGGALGGAGYVGCDAAGGFLLRKPLAGLTLPRFGAACPLWPLYQALSRPLQPMRARVEIAGRIPQRFLCHAVAQPSWPLGLDGPEVLEAGMLILPDPDPDPGTAAQPVGLACRICPRPECLARREPSILTEGLS
ncbi:helix-turn-helix domain-containing protein [Phaeovulum vinaykumarii]|uniref:HTH cro/C1-type domain-containing protein n=1 Tax=Phaeovulum vinaykumarii TaxID=407234 RepID=A0A1N7LJ34_9RHOB|nr:helix-turn-helix domain-containing protein [Phaeovulum vinaykumarii]SIS73809.1 hypothetical protein SAMN05421795_103108 [Phaeovulum vinaykumarii]SOC04786.1 hypothetical protein SAMN05878426_103108 [Phaeovulum vinaykumarii]